MSERVPGAKNCVTHHYCACTEQRLLDHKDVVEKLRRGYSAELKDVEAELAPALGYLYDEVYGWVTGDHTAVTLAMEARRKIERLSERERELEAALRFYADPASYRRKFQNERVSLLPDCLEDNGERARQVLSRIKEGTGEE